MNTEKTSESNEPQGEHAEAPQTKASDNKSTETSSKHDPVRRFTWIVLGTIAALLLWYVAADRVAPWTDQARVQAWIIPITPKVSGKVKKIAVTQNQVIKAGDLLAKIDPEKYELSLLRAEAALEIAGQEIGAGTASVSTAQARLVEARATLQEYEIQVARIEAVEKKAAISKAEADSARAARAKARAQADSAAAELEKAKRQLGVEGDDNPKIRDALAQLKQARIDLADTEIYAPGDGGITNLKIDEGYYAKAGSPLMTFVAFDDHWIQANFRENSISNIQIGDPAEIVLDMLPGTVLKGKVTSRGFAVKQPTYGATGEAVTVKGHSGWLRDAQRFPVFIEIEDERAVGNRFAGGQADVQIYTQESNGLLNGLGWLWIRFISWLSYAY